MEIIETAVGAHRFAARQKKRRVLVPTMGALHRGHLELIRLARAAAGTEGTVAVSIFVNPLQFEPGADFERYPRPQSVDEDLCRKAGVDLFFRPEVSEMYSSSHSVAVEESSLSQTLCGASRPGHFKGVCTVVTKLFHLLAPQAAIFGEKDFQQLAIIKKLVRDLNFPIEIIGAPIVREPDGLACSSRNEYLNAQERSDAPMLRTALLEAVELVREGEMTAQRITSAARCRIESAHSARIDYLEVVDANSLQTQTTVDASSVLAGAVFFGWTRLIDNIRLS